MEEDGDAGSERLPSLVWKEPINGKTAFFTEEVYRKLVGPEPTLEERVSKMMDDLGFPPPSSGGNSSWMVEQPDDPQRNTDSWTVPHTSCGSGEVNQEDVAASSSQSGHMHTETVVEGSKEVVSLELEDTPASPDTPLSPVSQDGAHEVELEHHNVASEQEFTTHAGNSATVLIPTSRTAISGKDDESAASGTPMNSDPGPSRGLAGHGEGSQFMANGSLSQSGPENNTKRDINVDTAGQARYAAHRTKMHDKGRRPPMPEAPKSSLTHEQHLHYLHLFKKCMQRFFSGSSKPPTQSELQELQEFESLQHLVVKEQGECQNHLKAMAEQNSYLYTHLPTHFTQYTREKEQSGWKRAEIYCRYYNTDGQLPLTPDLSQMTSADAPTTLPTLSLVQTLLELGSKCKVVMPDMNPNPNTRARRTVCTELPKVTARFPPVYTSNQRSWNHEPASKDSNLASLVRKYPCHIATSASVLKQLIDNHGPDFGVAWEIPVVVRDCESGSGSKRRVVYLDKPLLPSVRSLSQKKTQYLKKALLAYVCQPHNERRSAVGRGRSNAKGQEEVAEPGESSHGRAVAMETEQDDDPFGSVSMEDLETFGSDMLSSNSRRKATDLKGGVGKQQCGARTGSQVSGSQVSGNQVLGSQVSGSCVGEGLGTQVSDVRKTEAQNKKDVVAHTSDTKGDGSETLAGNGSKPLENSAVETDPQSEAKTDATSSSANAESASAAAATAAAATSYVTSSSGGGVCGGQANSSDEDEDALVIAEANSPVRLAGGSPSKIQQHAMWRRSHDPRGSSIFDEISPSAVPAADVAEGQTTPLRRVTRSVSQKLQSPGHESGSCGGGGGEGVSDAGHTGTPASESTAASPRMTRRQSWKRQHGESQGAASQESEGVSSGVDEEPAARAKKGRPATDYNSPAATTSSAAGKPAEPGGDGTEEKASVDRSTVPSVAEAGSSEKQSVDMAPNYLDSLLNKMTPMGSGTSIKLQEDPCHYQAPDCWGDQVSYHLWDLGGTSLIVRCNGHAFFRDMRQLQKAVYVSAKPEHQLPQGVEQNTLSECVRGWLGCYLRPNSYLLRARVNVQNYEVVHTEELQLNQILQPSLNFSPQYAFAVLKNIFTKLTELPAGSYLLSHEAGANHILLKSGTVVRRGSYDLRSRYMGLIMQEPDRSVPWVPVDPTIMLPHHWRMGLIPATFQPPDFELKRRKQQQFVQQKKKHNKKKN